jgi:hypothetical protein
VFAHGSSTASTKSVARVPCKFANLRCLSEASEHILISSARGTRERVSESDIRRSASKSWRQWKL